MRSRIHASLAAAFIAVTLAACAGTPPKNSGYLGDDYALLKEAKDPLGAPLQRFISPNFTPANYNALMIEPFGFYPEPRPTEQVSMGAINDIRDYINNSLRAKLGAKVNVVDKPGPGVARLRGAVTALNAATVDLKPYQYLPFALVATAAKDAATGGRPEDARIFVEVEIQDSMTGGRLAVAVREGTGEILKKATSGGKMVTLESVKPVLDKWLDAVALASTQFIKAK
ncbi:MAG: DUF3313 domain-containing protein [Burkholderiales bacterium]